MSAEMVTEVSRYEGLIQTLRDVHDAHEESGWRQANLIHDALSELREQGLWLRKRGFTGSAPERLSRDLGRHRMGASTVYRYYLTWTRYGAAGQRLDGLSFYDHLVLSRESSPSNPAYPSYIAALQKRRADMEGGRKPEHSDALSTIIATRNGPARARLVRDLTTLAQAKSRLRRFNKTNVWDYPDHQKVLDHIAEIEAEVAQIKAKPWDPGHEEQS